MFTVHPELIDEINWSNADKDVWGHTNQKHRDKKYPVGIEINANHISSPTDGYVYAKATPVHIGGSTSVWNIDITNDAGKRVAFSRFTAMHKNHPKT